MTFKTIFRNAIAIFAVGAVAVLAVPAHAQMKVLGPVPPLRNSNPEVAGSSRLILHGVRLRGNELAPGSQQVLDYAATLLRQYPEDLVYVSGKGENATIHRQTRAVARYLARRGVPANRLVLATAAPFPQAIEASSSAFDNGVIVLNLAPPTCGICS